MVGTSARDGENVSGHVKPRFSRLNRVAVSLLFISRPLAGGDLVPMLTIATEKDCIKLELLPAQPGVYSIRWTPSLGESGGWTCLELINVSKPTAMSVFDVRPASGQRFYHAVAVTNMVWIPPGTFVMGSPATEALRGQDEAQHTVTLTRGFYIGKYEVTQGEYLSVMGINPSYFTPAHGYSLDLNRPVEQVEWEDATNYCHRLTQLARSEGRIPTNWVFRLPTESEWEYACRAGTSTAFCYGEVLRGGMANFNGMCEYDARVGEYYVPPTPETWLERTTTVGSYRPNAFGVYDMHGNVWEWCQDWYGDYPTGHVTDPEGPASGSFHVFRGGTYNYYAYLCRSALRLYNIIDAHPNNFGFRVVLAEVHD